MGRKCQRKEGRKHWITCPECQSGGGERLWNNEVGFWVNPIRLESVSVSSCLDQGPGLNRKFNISGVRTQLLTDCTGQVLILKVGAALMSRLCDQGGSLNLQCKIIFEICHCFKNYCWLPKESKYCGTSCEELEKVFILVFMEENLRYFFFYPEFRAATIRHFSFLLILWFDLIKQW